jgi:hypothetical protein
LVEVDALRVEVSAADNLGLAELVAEVGGEAYAFDLPSTSLDIPLEGRPAGPLSVRVQATDRAGNVAEASSEATLDRPPVVQIVEPAPGASVSGTVTFRAESSDDTPRGPVVWSLDGRPLRAADIDAATWEAPYAYGEHTVEARLSDARGRTAQDALSFTVDHPLELRLYVCLVGAEFMGEPACGEFSPEQLEGLPFELNGTITFEATPSDDEPVEELVRLQIDDRAPLMDTSAPFEFSWNTDTEDEGPHTLTFSARNLRGVARLFTVEVVVNRCDLDHDGVPSVACGGGDCDDDDAGRALGLPEVCDLRDNDCDAQIDEGVVLPEGPCGPCGDGAWVCDPLQGQQCLRASPLSACIDEVCAEVCEQIAACPGFEQRCASGEPEAFATACEAECEPLLLQFNLVPDDACGLIQEVALSTDQVRDVCDPPAQRCARACDHQAECLAPICGEAVPSCLEGCLQDPATADGLERQGCLSAQRDLCAGQGGDHGCDCALVPPISGIGGPCEVDSDCTNAYGQPFCVNVENQQGMGWINGYCASIGCNTNNDCGPGGFCYLEQGLGVCLASCDDDAQCRPGYVCGALFGDNTACGPGCNNERPCPEGLSCDPNSACQ